MIDWRGHGTSCPCDRCEAFRRTSDLTSGILLALGAITLILFALRIIL